MQQQDAVGQPNIPFSEDGRLSLHRWGVHSGGSLEMCEIKFGNDSATGWAEIVDGWIDAHQTPKPPWIERKERYLACLGRSDDFDIMLVKCADCLSNARPPLRDYRLKGDEVWNRFTGMPCATCQRSWYASVREALRPLGQSASCLAELDQAVSALVNESDHLTALITFTCQCPRWLQFLPKTLRIL